MQDISILTDNEEVFRTSKPKSGKLDIPDASTWYIVNLPPNIQGKTFTMILSSDIEAFTGTINLVFAGEGNVLLYKTISEQKLAILISMNMFIFSIVELIISLAVKNYTDIRIMYLGVFFVTICIWIFSESRLMQLFTGNRFIIGGISYMMLSLIAIPFVLCLRDAIFIKNKRI